MDVLLHKAAVVSDVAIIRRLVAEGADVNEPGANGTRPLPLRHTMGMWQR
jgi:ankyrin repeat protein